MKKTILITGARRGFGKGAAFGLAQKGHKVIATVRKEADKKQLLEEAVAEGIDLQVELLDITNEEQRKEIFKLEIDVLMNNAGIMEAGPVAEMPLEIVRRNYEVNVFGSLAMAQGFAPQMVKRGSGKIIFVSSMGGLITVPLVGIYTSTKHAIEGLAEGMKAELAGTGVEICTANPGAFATGFNDEGAATMGAWFNPEKTLSRPELFAGMEGGLENQFDPQIMIDALVKIAEEDNSKFRNVVPEAIIPWIKAIQEKTWTATKDDNLFIDPTSL